VDAIGNAALTLAVGEHVILREQVPADVDSYLHWFKHGEWRQWDAPWEDGIAATPEEEAKFRERFASMFEKEAPSPRRSAIIATRDGAPLMSMNRPRGDPPPGHRCAGSRRDPNGVPLGWVNRYNPKDDLEDWHVGIDICEDAYLNRGLGTEALRLWVDYLFENSDVHRISLGTWSFNERMMRVAEKAGFTCEGRRRELREWQDKWIDYIAYGVLRREWGL